MPSKIYSASIIGLEALEVTIEVDTGGGLHKILIVGLPDTAVSESKERVSSAVKNLPDYRPPYKFGKVVINLAPADLKKEGPVFDLPIAIGFLKATNQIDFDYNGKLFIGELALDGTTRPVKGILSTAIFAKNHGFDELFIPHENRKEASLVKGLTIRPIKTLQSVIDHINNRSLITPYTFQKNKTTEPNSSYGLDFSDIKGQEQAKRALEVAAAGGHNVLMSGAPGSGKTMLAKTLPTILPDMTEQEMVEVTKIFSVSGLISTKEGLITTRPFRSPHHSASGVSLVGGGSVPKPGEVSLAHRGVLFLDELPEFDRHVLENLRQPLEDGTITITRAGGSAQFPARFILVASMNPCPCGYLGDSQKECSCNHVNITRYQKTISGPLLDRIDMLISVPRLPYEKIRLKNNAAKKVEKSEDIRERVKLAREVQAARYKDIDIITNSELTTRMTNEYCPLDLEGESILKSAVENLQLSARSIFRILKVGRTIADLEDSENIKPEHVAEAVQYRKGILGE